MKQREELADLCRITQAAYDRERQKFQTLIARETQLRQELAQLDRVLKASHALPESEAEMRAVGADLLWQGWIGRSRAELNLKLAQVLAQKEHYLQQVRIGFGKMTVAQELHREADAQHRQQVQQDALEAALESFCAPARRPGQ